jgi:hypothetical protein
MEIHQVQDLIEKNTKFNWPLLDTGAKTTNFHESDWVLIDRGFEIVGCFPNRVKAEEVMKALESDDDRFGTAIQAIHKYFYPQQEFLRYKKLKGNVAIVHFHNPKTDYTYSLKITFDMHLSTVAEHEA